MGASLPVAASCRCRVRAALPRARSSAFAPGGPRKRNKGMSAETRRAGQLLPRSWHIGTGRASGSERGDTALGRERKMTGLSCPSSHQRNRLRSEGTLFKPDDRAWRRLLTQCSGYGSAGPTGAACSKSSAESAGSGGPAGRLSGRLCRESSAGPAGRRSADFAEKLSSAESAGCLGRSGRFCSGPNGLNTKMLSTTGPPNLPPSRPHLLTSVGFPSRKTRLRQIDAKRPRHGEGWYPPPGTPRSKHANPCDCASGSIAINL